MVVHLYVKSDERGHGVRGEFGYHVLQGLLGCDGVDLVEQRHDRLGAELIHAGGVHACSKVVKQLPPFLRAGGALRVLKQLCHLLRDELAGEIPRLDDDGFVGRYGRLFYPLAAHVLVEVVTGVDREVHCLCHIS